MPVSLRSQEAHGMTTRPGTGPRLLVLTSTFPRWKGDTCPMFVADLCKGLAENFDVTVLAPSSKGARDLELWDGVTVRRYRYCWPAGTQRLADGAILPNIRGNRLLAAQVPLFVTSQLLAAYRLARHERFDVIHAHWLLPQGWIAGILKACLGVPFLTTAHGGDVYSLRARPWAEMKRWVARLSDRITAVSTSLQQELFSLGVPAERVRVLPMGVDTQRFTPEAASPKLRRQMNPDGPILLFVGRLVEKKGARYAIEAMPIILRRVPSARLILIGDGPQKGSLIDLVTDLGLDTRVQFLGALPHDRLPAYFASADVFIGPSVVEASGDTEAFGLVFGEAMASGCPVVATNVGGISDLVVHGETGVLVPQQNAAAIADAASALLLDPAQRQRLRANGLARVREKFDLRGTVAKYREVLTEVTG